MRPGNIHLFDMLGIKAFPSERLTTRTYSLCHSVQPLRKDERYTGRMEYTTRPYFVPFYEHINRLKCLKKSIPVSYSKPSA